MLTIKKGALAVSVGDDWLANPAGTAKVPFFLHMPTKFTLPLSIPATISGLTDDAHVDPYA